MPGKFNFKCVKGVTFRRLITWSDVGGTPVNITGAPIALTIYTSSRADAAILAVLDTDGGKITLTDPTNGTFQLEALDDVTLAYTFSAAFYKLVLTLGDEVTLLYGEFNTYVNAVETIGGATTDDAIITVVGDTVKIATIGTVINVGGGGGGTPGGTNGQVQYNNAGSFGGFTASGDATVNVVTGAVAVTKTGGVPFAASATADTTNAANISIGTLSDSRLSSNVPLKNGTNAFSGSNTFPTQTASDGSTKAATTAYADNAASTAQSAAVSTAVSTAETFAANASNISSGTLSASRLPSTVVLGPQSGSAHNFVTGFSSSGVQITGRPSSSDLSDASSIAPSASKYLLQQADAALPNAQAMGALSTGIVKNTTTTGVLSIAIAGTDYLAPGALPNGTTATTQTAADASTKVATTAYVDTAVAGVSGGGGAPTTATYITQTPNGSLSAEQALSALATGIVKVTTSTGVLSTAVAGTDYVSPSAPFDFPSNASSLRRVTWWNLSTPTATTWTAIGSTGTQTTAAMASATNTEGTWVLGTTATTLNSSASVLGSAGLAPIQIGPKMVCRIKPIVFSNSRIWIGLFSATPLGVDSLGAISGVGLRCSASASDITWQMVSSNGSTQTTTPNTASAAPSSNVWEEITVDCSVAGTVTFLHNGVNIGSLTTNLPAAATSLSTVIGIEVSTAGVAQTMGVQGTIQLSTN